MWAERPDSILVDEHNRPLSPFPSGVVVPPQQPRPISMVPTPSVDSLRHNVHCRNVPISNLSSVPMRKPLKNTAAYEQFSLPRTPSPALLDIPAADSRKSQNRLSSMFLSVMPHVSFSTPSTPTEGSHDEKPSNRRRSRVSTWFGRNDAPAHMRPVSMYVGDKEWIEKQDAATPSMTVTPYEEDDEEQERRRRQREERCYWLCG